MQMWASTTTSTSAKTNSLPGFHIFILFDDMF